MNYFKKTIIYVAMIALIFQISVWTSLYAYPMIDDNGIEPILSTASLSEMESHDFDRVNFKDSLSQPQGTVITADVTANTTWSPSGSPYTIEKDDFIVARNAILTILPGTIVQIPKRRDFIVSDGGTLIAEGTKSQPIIFTCQPEECSRYHWNDLRFSEGSKIRLSNCKIMHGLQIIVAASDSIITDCDIEEMDFGMAIIAPITLKQNPIVRRLRFRDNTTNYVDQSPFRIGRNSDPEIEDISLPLGVPIYLDLEISTSFPYTYVLESANYFGYLDTYGENTKFVIQPGTTFDNIITSFSGKVIANGTAENPIRFTLSDRSIRKSWKGLRFDAERSSIISQLSNCIIEYAEIAIETSQNLNITVV